MDEQFDFNIPLTENSPLTFSLKLGEVLYLLGANGSGKSSLINHLISGKHAYAKRISALRHIYFESNAVNMTASSRESFEKNVRSQDSYPRSRHNIWNGTERAGAAIFDLIDSDNMQERKIAEFVRAGNMAAAKGAAKSPSPLEAINDLMQLSNLPIQLSLEPGQKVIAKKNGGSSYSVAELSDGERNSFLLAAEVLTAKPGTLLLIDEPERHLHRSIISPLLKLLFDKRKDCTFIVSTHELKLPVDTPHSRTLLVRSCEYENGTAKTWKVDELLPQQDIDDELKSDILGSRQKIIYVEGTATSLDAPLYSLLFPQVSIIPKGGCKEVEQAVRGLRGATGMHWMSVWGIVDNDQRTDAEVQQLRTAGIWALSQYSIESLYYSKDIIELIAARQVSIIGGHANVLTETGINNAISALKEHKEHLISKTVHRWVRKEVNRNLPKLAELKKDNKWNLAVDVPNLFKYETEKFDQLVTDKNWDGLLNRYSLRESPAFHKVVEGLNLVDDSTYKAAVLKLLQDDQSALASMRNQLGDLFEHVTAAENVTMEMNSQIQP